MASLLQFFVDEVCILSGDGDYLPAIREAMRRGIRVYVGAFSSGLNSRL
ncbi:NYN domain-containing protein [uncultured Paraburkholderia sp.]